MTRDYRTRNGRTECKRYAYRHKRDATKFGLLHAVDYADARRWLGSAYRIRVVWVPCSDVYNIQWDETAKRTIVDRVFANAHLSGDTPSAPSDCSQGDTI